MPLIETKGAGSAQGFGEFTAGAPKTYIEDVFSTYLYTGNDGTLPIVNGIDLSTYGGMTWIKSRTYGGGGNHQITDTVRGINAIIKPNLTDATATASGNNLVSFNTTGFTLGSGFSGYSNFSGSNNVVWTFRKQPKFFDVVTGTCDGSGNITVNHSLGSVPGFVTIKRTDGVSAWNVYHTSLGNNQYLQLNGTNAVGTLASIWNATSTTFTANCGFAAGAQVVLYLWASNAGGFGLTGSDNVISCGSFTTDGSGNATVNLGYEPQWVLYKSTATGAYDNDWYIADNMRGWSNDGSFGQARRLSPDTAGAESNSGSGFCTSTGFYYTNQSFSNSYIYIAIRRGPMKVPTTGTSVFYPTTYSGNVQQAQNVGFNGDLLFAKQRTTAGDRSIFIDRLRGARLLNAVLSTGELTPADFGLSINQFPSLIGSGSSVITSQQSNYAYIPVGDAGWNSAGNTYVDYIIARAPKFFDIVCYTGTGSAQSITHNLTVVPDLMIGKRRNGSVSWPVYPGPLSNANYFLKLDQTDALGAAAGVWNSTAPTSSVFTVGTDGSTNASTATYVMYLFATLAGISKIGTYTGTGAAVTVDCGFTSGARFVLIKRYDTVGDWYLYDSQRGISSSTDPYLIMNTTAAEVTGTNYVDATLSGFGITAAAPVGLNASGGTYIFLAIA